MNERSRGHIKEVIQLLWIPTPKDFDNSHHISQLNHSYLWHLWIDFHNVSVLFMVYNDSVLIESICKCVTEFLVDQFVKISVIQL